MNNKMQDVRISYSALLVVVVITFLSATIGGAAAGAIIARRVAGDDTLAVASQPAPAQAGVATPPTVRTTPTTAATARASAATPTPAIPIATPGVAPAAEGIAATVSRVNPAVVTVINKASFQGFFNSGDDLQPLGSGTGFVVSQDGVIVTNNHVVAGSQALDVIFDDGTKAEARLVGTDPFTDLAVIQVDIAVPAVVPLGASAALQSGDTVIAIGSALGNYTNTVTTGVVSALGRRLELDAGMAAENLIQHDAPINPGNSGGPLLNQNGEVVGVNTYAIHQAADGRYADGLGFAVTSETVQQITTILLAEGVVARPYMGIAYDPLTPLTAESQGLSIDNGILVTQVPSGGPARNAGITEGDVITRLNGQPIDREHPFVNLLFGQKPGDTVAVELYRPSTNEVINLQVILATRAE
jgi:2-alkenal reductase